MNKCTGQEVLQRQRQAWLRKPSLRMIYGAWFKAIGEAVVSGNALEIGCGIGQLKAYVPGLFTLDVMKTPWTDVVGDAQALPFKAESVSNLILFDVLHHLSRPTLFFSDALRVLRKGGRVIIVEPYVSPLSRFVYQNFHPEPVRTNCDPLLDRAPLSSDDPFDSNSAVATVIFFRRLRAWREKFRGFRLLRRHRFAFFAYPATGGFGGKKLLPDRIIGLLHRMEGFWAPLAGLLAFRTFVILQKKGQ